MAKLITVEEAAERAGRTTRTIRKWQEQEKLTRYKVPATGENLVDRVELDRLLKPVARSAVKH